MNADLLDFTRRALEQGVARDKIADALAGAGWSEPDIRAAVNAFAELDFPTPVPRPRPYLSAQEVFTYGLMFAALYITAFNLGALGFQFIDLALPDPGIQRVMGIDYVRQAMRGNISALVVAFPLFLFLFRGVRSKIAKDPTKRQSRPRKWLTYVTLLITAAVLIGDVGTLIYDLLGGELTTRILLKIAIVAIIAGGAFGYFMVDVRQDERE